MRKRIARAPRRAIVSLQRRTMMTRISFLALASLLLLGCDRHDFRNGHKPGEVEVVRAARVYHLADGVFIEERKGGSTVHYLIEDTAADYELTATGLDVVMVGDHAATYSTTPAPAGYVAAWITLIPADGLEITRFEIDPAVLAGLLKKFSAATTVRDIYNLKK